MTAVGFLDNLSAATNFHTTSQSNPDHPQTGANSLGMGPVHNLVTISDH